MKTLLIDGQWNLKRNFHKRKYLSAKGELCGGTFGFIDSLRATINRVLPDRIIVFWDGHHSGILRYDVYKPYKANRKKNWAINDNAISTDGLNSSDDAEKLEMIKQTIKVQEYLDELFIRQLEVDLIEADDLIAYYILNSKIRNEDIIIFSRDGDYRQLISKKVSLLTPDSIDVITIENFEKKFGHTIENELLFKCFEGDTSDNIKGVKGITRKKLIKYFPEIEKEKYLYKRLVSESKEKMKEKKLKVYETIIEAEEILYRNAKLMNLKKPFINEEVKEEMEKVMHGILDSSRSINNAMDMFVKNEYITFLEDRDLNYFFSPFYMMMSKEKEYENSMKL